MSSCTFFGHRDCYGLEARVLKDAIRELIDAGVDTFYVGDRGGFDRMVFHCLQELEKEHPHISVAVVLAYLPVSSSVNEAYGPYHMYPPIEEGPPRFAIERRNRWMIDHATHCLVFINRIYGGAYKFAKLARSRDLSLRNLGSLEL